MRAAWAGASGLGQCGVDTPVVLVNLDLSLSVTPQGLGTGEKVPGVRTA